MTVHTQKVTAGPYIGDGISNIFTFNFKILNAQYLEVRADDNVLTLHTDYEVSFSDEAGQITLTAPLAVDVELFIIRTTPITQEHDYVQGDSFPADSHEGALDKLTLIAQEVSERMDRAILTHIGDEGGEVFPSKAQRANTLLGFDSNSAAQAVSMGNGVELAGTVLKVKIGDALIFQNGGINLNPFVVAEISAATTGVADLNNSLYWLDTRVTTLELSSGGTGIKLGVGLYFDALGNLSVKHDGTLEVTAYDEIGLSSSIIQMINSKAAITDLPTAESLAGNNLSASAGKINLADSVTNTLNAKADQTWVVAQLATKGPLNFSDYRVGCVIEASPLYDYTPGNDIVGGYLKLASDNANGTIRTSSDVLGFGVWRGMGAWTQTNGKCLFHRVG